MRIIVQRVKSSSVIVKDQIIANISQGLNLLVGISITDTEAELDWMVRKCLDLRLFPVQDTNRPWAQSIIDIQGEILVVSQFTLYGDCRKGRCPSFSNAASPEIAESLYNLFVDKLKQSGLRVATGKFGAMMEVKLDNDGPVTLILERESTSD